MLDVRELAVSFAGARDALAAVNLKVRAGELVALSGEPGSGKSALVGCVAGDLEPTQGAISVDGRYRDDPGRACGGGLARCAGPSAVCDRSPVTASGE